MYAVNRACKVQITCRIFMTLVAAAAPALSPSLTLAQVSFQDKTVSAGIIRDSESWGASWGDWTGDGRPDLWVGNHRNRPDFWRNNGDGTFTNMTLLIDPSRTLLDDPYQDTHGAAWADFDNDGDQDLGITTTGRDFRFMVNTNGTFTDRAKAYALDNDSAGRLPSWFDFTRDGRLDVAQVAFSRAYFRQQNSGSSSFTDVTSTLGISSSSCSGNYGQLSDLNNDGIPEFMCMDEGDFPKKIYDTSTVPYKNISSIAPGVGTQNDSAVADFNNDLRPDLFFTRSRLRPSEATKVSANGAEAWVVSSGSATKGFSFKATGSVTIDVNSEQPHFVGSNVSIGNSNTHPSSIPFTVNPGSVNGMASNGNIRVGYNSSTQTWAVMLYPNSGGSNVSAYFTATGSGMSNVAGVNLKTDDGPMTPKLLLNTGSGFQDVTSQVGLNAPISCDSVVAEDFDNDMDIDLYLVCRGMTENIVNRYYENLGNGTFREVTGFGAEGAVGSGLASGAGAGESVIVADYDVDGRPDLLVTNGLRLLKGSPSNYVGPLREVGPVELFRNTTTDGNNWIELDLVGTGTSNRDATGSKVYATAGGVTQLREQNGGYHRWSQNDRRIHFGLAHNGQADIQVRWPNGTVEQFNGLQANRLYRVTEGGSAQAETLNPVPPFPTPTAGDECGAPQYLAKWDRAVFVWKDCTSGVWSVQVTAGDYKSATYSGTVTAAAGQTFTSVTRKNLESGEGDVVNSSDPTKIVYHLSPQASNEDGFGFTLPTGATGCFSAQLPPGAMVLLGAGTKPVPAAFDLGTFAACTNSVSLSIADASGVETDGMLNFTVSLSSASSSTVTVDYQTQPGTATAPADYTSVSDTLVFNPGQTSKTISVPLIDDGISEGPETFTVQLGNASNAVISDGTAVGTINDGGSSGVSPCGMPSYDKAVDQGVYLWRDCGTDIWHMAVTAGGAPSQIIYQGDVTFEPGGSQRDAEQHREQRRAGFERRPGGGGLHAEDEDDGLRRLRLYALQRCQCLLYGAAELAGRRQRSHRFCKCRPHLAYRPQYAGQLSVVLTSYGFLTLPEQYCAANRGYLTRIAPPEIIPAGRSGSGSWAVTT